MKIIDILPSSLKVDPQVVAACEAIDRQLGELYTDIPQVAFWPNLDKQVSPLLDVLMWEYHVDIHQMIIARQSQPLTDEKKRQLIDESILWHQKKGTKWIIEHALAALFERIEVVEWYEYGGRPYFFKIIASSALEDPNLYENVLQIVYELKNVRSWLEEFIIARPTRLDLWEASVTIRRVTNQVYLMQRPSVSDEEFYVGLAVCIYRIRTIFAPEE